MATTREQIDSRGRNLLQLLIENERALHNVMNPSSRDQDTYDGPGHETVNISWPMGASTVGSAVPDSVKYFLREFNLENVNTTTIGEGRAAHAGDGVLTHIEQYGDDVEWGNVPLSRRNQGKQHNQPFVDNNSGYATDRSSFMNRSKRKSLATLYWEMRGAFVNNSNKPYFKAQGQDGEDKTWTNRFGGSSDIDTYDGNFVAQNNELYFPPSGEGITISSSNGFVLGQVLGGDTNIIQRLIDKGAEITTEWFAGLIEDAGENEFLKSFLLKSLITLAAATGSS